jgi:hypothetical protein
LVTKLLLCRLPLFDQVFPVTIAFRSQLYEQCSSGACLSFRNQTLLNHRPDGPVHNRAVEAKQSGNLKQVSQQASTGDIAVLDVPAPRLVPGCVLVRMEASLISAGTARASCEFASKNLLEKARARPYLVREVINKVQRDGVFSTAGTRASWPETNIPFAIPPGQRASRRIGSVCGRGELPIPFDQIVSTTLATCRAVESRSSGQPVEVDTTTFIRSNSQSPRAVS